MEWDGQRSNRNIIQLVHYKDCLAEHLVLCSFERDVICVKNENCEFLLNLCTDSLLRCLHCFP